MAKIIKVKSNVKTIENVVIGYIPKDELNGLFETKKTLYYIDVATKDGGYIVLTKKMIEKIMKYWKKWID